MAVVRSFLPFLFLMTVKLVSLCFFRVRTRWLSPRQDWRRLRLVVFLNHTSLWEPLFFGALPPSFLWDFVIHGVYPAADSTFRRPIVGRFFKSLGPRGIPISRKRDASWQTFLAAIDDRSIMAIMPEGRMKRADGLDKHGQPMTVKGGVAELLRQMKPEEDIMLMYSAGLHHVQVPGEVWPRLFKSLHLSLERLSAQQFLDGLASSDTELIVRELERRRDLYCQTF